MHDNLWQGPELTFPLYEKWWKLLWWEQCKGAGVGKSQKGLHVSSHNVKKAQKNNGVSQLFYLANHGKTKCKRAWQEY